MMSDHEGLVLNPIEGGIQPVTGQPFITQSLSFSSFQHLDMTLIMLKGT